MKAKWSESMSRRKDRLSHVIRDVVSDAIANRVSDPRISSLTSVTRVEMSPDLKIADVHVSVMGEDADARTTLRGLTSARGMIQTRLARKLNIRQCPMIRFRLDAAFKGELETLRQIEALNPHAAEDAVGDAADEIEDPSSVVERRASDTEDGA